MQINETRIGKVRSVNGTKIFATLEPGMAVAPVIHGRMHHVTQVGTILKVNIGASQAIGHVISATAASDGQETLEETTQRFGWFIAPGEKALVLNLFGEIRGGEFERGLTTFPDIDSEVHVITTRDLHAIYSSGGVSAPLIFGEIAGGVDLPATLDLQKLVMRHGAIVGSTGTGKSNAVSIILREVGVEIEGKKKWPGAKAIVIDLHGEYSDWAAKDAKTFSIDGALKLQLPYWLIPFEELLSFFMGRQITQEDLGARNLKEAILTEKIEWLESNGLDELAKVVTVDSPVPFNLRKIWYEFYVKENATYIQKGGPDIAWARDGDGRELKGNADAMVLPKFMPPAPGGASPFSKATVGITSTGTAPILEKIRSRCLDRNYSFIFGDETNQMMAADLEEIVADWLDKPSITILDLNGVPSNVLDITIGTISRLFFDLWRWGRLVEGLGKSRPIYLIFDEAHLYLSDNKYGFNTGAAIRGVTRILREGRKYGVGALIVSQRPSDINAAIFSQIGTIISLRLNNGGDLGIIKEALSDNLSEIADSIPSLRTGEAIVSGEATPLPLRARFEEIKNRAHGADAKIVGAWDKMPTLKGLKKAIKQWRSQGH